MIAPTDKDSEPVKPGRRQRSRLRVRLRARLSTRTLTEAVILEDLSLHGAKIITHAVLKPGTEAVLEWHGFEAFGEVVWCASGRCGLSFFDMITPEVLLATRDLDDAGHLPRDSDLARESAQQWAQGKTQR